MAQTLLPACVRVIWNGPSLENVQPFVRNPRAVLEKSSPLGVAASGFPVTLATTRPVCSAGVYLLEIGITHTSSDDTQRCAHDQTQNPQDQHGSPSMRLHTSQRNQRVFGFASGMSRGV